MGVLIPLALLLVIGVFVTIGVGLNVYRTRATHRVMDQDVYDRFAMMEARLAELEERVDFAEHALSKVTAQRKLLAGE